MGKLRVGEWRLFLLSDCIKYYKDVELHTCKLRKEGGKKAILQLTNEDAKELDNFISDEDVRKILVTLSKEWRFTGKVVDNGRGVKTVCELCQYQHIRYKYICRNDKTDTWLALGSVCVGNILYGFDKMENKEFNKKVVGDLQKYRMGNPQADNPQVREEQKQLIGICANYLRGYGYTPENNQFLNSLQLQWNTGKNLTEGQIEGLKRFCKGVRNKYGKKVAQ